MIIRREFSKLSNGSIPVTLRIILFELSGRNMFFFFRKVIVINRNLWGFHRRVRSDLYCFGCSTKSISMTVVVGYAVDWVNSGSLNLLPNDRFWGVAMEVADFHRKRIQ